LDTGLRAQNSQFDEIPEEFDMAILRGVLGKIPSGPKSRVRNFIANKEFGTQSDVHENVISPGVTLPWHFHETEEIIVVFEGNGECRTDEGTVNYAAGDVISQRV
jgi:quercetin dioxygenase-like cupin family protein